MAKRELLMLAHKYDPIKHGVAGMFVSEKLDGIRAWWDGGVTRGMPASEVPYANVEKDYRYVAPPVATGLWTRYGNVVQAPGWWLDELPPHTLDGELWMGRGGFQELVSVTKCLIPDLRWDRVQYRVIDIPAPSVLLADGTIDVPNFRKVLSGAAEWHARRAGGEAFVRFEQALDYLRRTLVTTRHVSVHPQEMLPFSTAAAEERLAEMLAEVTEGGGEGLVLRRPSSTWLPERSHSLLKVKRMQDAEATVIGYRWGRETDRGSKLLGMMGALTVWTDTGITFDLSGFTEAEREMAVVGVGEWAESYAAARTVGKLHPGEVVGPGFHNPAFPTGSRITYMYRELTTAGVPKEARYLRRRT